MRPERSGRRALVAACLLTLVGSGCTPSDPLPPSPTSTPSPTITENAQEREERLAYEAAEKSYREFRAEYIRLTRLGGATAPTAVIERTTGGSYQKELMGFLKVYKETQARTRGSEEIPTIKRNGYSTTSLAIRACEDDRNLRTVDKRGKVLDNGDVLVVDLEVRNVSGTWKVWSGTGKGAKSCDSF